MAWPPCLAGLLAICLASHARASATNFMQRASAGSDHELRGAADMPCLGPWCALWVTPVREHRDALIFENKNMQQEIARLSAENRQLKGEIETAGAARETAKNKQLALHEAVHPDIHDREELQDVVTDFHKAKADDASFVELFKTTTASLLTQNKNLQESMQAVTRDLKRAGIGNGPHMEMRMKSFAAAGRNKACAEVSGMGEAMLGKVGRFSEETAKLTKAILEHNQGATDWAARARSTSRMAKVLQQLQELVDTYQTQKHNAEKENKALQNKVSELEGGMDQCKNELLTVRTEMDQKCHEEKKQIGELLATRTSSQKKLIDVCLEEKKQLEISFDSNKRMTMEGFEAEKYKLTSDCTLQRRKLEEDLRTASSSLKAIQGRWETEKNETRREVTEKITKECNDQLSLRAKEKQELAHKNEELKANSDKTLGHYKDLWQEFQICTNETRRLKLGIGAANRLKDEAESRAADIESTHQRLEGEKEGCTKRKVELEETYNRVMASYNRCKSNMTRTNLQNQELTNTLQDAMDKLDTKTSMIKEAQEARQHCEVSVQRIGHLKDRLAKVNMQLTKEKLGMEKQLEEALGGFDNLFAAGASKHKATQKSVGEVRAKSISRPGTGVSLPLKVTTSGVRRTRKPLPPPFEASKNGNDVARLERENAELLARLSRKPDDGVAEDLAMHKMSVGSAIRKPALEDDASVREAALEKELDSLISNVKRETIDLKQKHRQLEGTIEALGSEGGGADAFRESS